MLETIINSIWIKHSESLCETTPSTLWSAMEHHGAKILSRKKKVKKREHNAPVSESPIRTISGENAILPRGVHTSLNVFKQ